MISRESAASLEPGGGGAERPLACVHRKDFGSFYRLHDRVVLGLIENFG